jgi:hypothetical protein
MAIIFKAQKGEKVIEVIAITGYKGSGKSTLRKHFEHQGYWYQAFATPLKNMLISFVCSQGCSPGKAYNMFSGDLKEKPSEYFGGRTPRYAMQTIGTEWRDMMSRNLFTDAWKRKALNHGRLEKIVVDDLRFLHEMEMLKNTPEFDTTIVLIHREGLIPSDNHVSEQEYLKICPDVVLYNKEGNPNYMIDSFNKEYVG